MSTYTLKENAQKQDRLYIYGSSRLGELVADAKNQDLCSISISEDELLNSREQAIEGLVRNLFSGMQDPVITDHIVDFWNIKWNDYFSRTETMPPSTNTIQTHQFNWNAWVEWMCKMKCYENLNSEVFGIWENHWNGRLQAFNNGSITCGYEDCQAIYTDYLSQWTENLNNEVIPNMQSHNFVSSCSVQNNVYVKGSRRYELSNHLGNVLAVVSDRKIESDEDYFYAGTGSGYRYENGFYLEDPNGEYKQNSGPDGIISSYSAEVISANDYYAFGSLMPGRSFSGGELKYGYNGKEYDDELKGKGNILDYGARMMDTRLGRWFAVEPLAYAFPMHSTYSYAANNPILFVDYDGRYFGIDDALAAAVGGAVNLGVALYKGDVKNFGQGMAYFGSGAAAGALALYPQFGGWAAGGAIVGGTDAAITEYNETGKVSFGNVATQSLIGATIGQVGGWFLS